MVFSKAREGLPWITLGEERRSAGLKELDGLAQGKAAAVYGGCKLAHCFFAFLKRRGVLIRGITTRGPPLQRCLLESVTYWSVDCGLRSIGKEEGDTKT